MTNNSKIFDEDYYLNGVKSGKSNYENYKWLPDLTIPMAKNLQKFIGFNSQNTVLDFGCARGYTVKALKSLGIDAWGFDISEWAINNSDEEIKKFVNNSWSKLPNRFDYIFTKDVLEHIPEEDLKNILVDLLNKVNKSLFIIVPITKEKNGKYVCPKDEMDITHVIRWNLSDWIEYLQLIDSRFIVFASCQLPGIKPMCYEYPMSYAFIKMERINND